MKYFKVCVLKIRTYFINVTLPIKCMYVTHHLVYICMYMYAYMHMYTCVYIHVNILILGFEAKSNSRLSYLVMLY